MQAAYELFSELNRVGHHHTVIRLYDKYELEFVSAKDQPYAERVQAQYEFARDNVSGMGISLGDADGTRVTSQSLNKMLFSK